MKSLKSTRSYTWNKHKIIQYWGEAIERIWEELSFDWALSESDWHELPGRRGDGIQGKGHKVNKDEGMKTSRWPGKSKVNFAKQGFCSWPDITKETCDARGDPEGNGHGEDPSIRGSPGRTPVHTTQIQIYSLTVPLFGPLWSPLRLLPTPLTVLLASGIKWCYPLIMEIENFIIRDVSYKAREERLELASTGSSCSLPKGQCHVACLPSLFSALRVNFPPHKKKTWQHLKTSRTLKLPSPNATALSSKWSPIWQINSRAIGWQTTKLQTYWNLKTLKSTLG